MKHGSVVQRHTRACPREPSGSYAPHRCRGPWRWVLEYGRDSQGARKQTGKSGYPTRAAAQSALQEAVQKYRFGASDSDVTVAEYLDGWLRGKHALKPKTVALYEDLSKHYLVPHLGKTRLLELKAEHLDRMYAAITVGRSGRPLSPSTIRRVHAVLRSALNSAVKRRLIPYSPAEHIELAPEQPRRPRPWTPEECLSFLQFAADDRLQSLYQLMLVTGMRRGEAIGLRWQDVDLPAQCLFVVQQITEVRGRSVVGTPKTRRGTRLIPLDAGTVADLVRHREGQDIERLAWGPAWNGGDLVFTRESGLPLRPEYATRHFQALAARAGLPSIRLHDLRHSNASLALQAGVDLKVISERLGHSQISVTADLYTHVNLGLGRAAADQIALALRTATATATATSEPQPVDVDGGHDVQTGASTTAAADDPSTMRLPGPAR